MIQTDIGVFEDQVELMIYLFTTPLRFLICIYFLYSLVGWRWDIFLHQCDQTASLRISYLHVRWSNFSQPFSCFLGLTTVIITMPIPAWISSQFGTIQERVMKATDKRLGLINEVCIILFDSVCYTTVEEELFSETIPTSSFSNPSAWLNSLPGRTRWRHVWRMPVRMRSAKSGRATSAISTWSLCGVWSRSSSCSWHFLHTPNSWARNWRLA